MDIIPLFKTHYSISKSILTLAAYDSERDPKVIEPDSAIQICKENGLDELVLVEDSMGGFMEAYQNCKECGLKLIFGFRVTFVTDATTDSEDNSLSSHKNIIFARNTRGYRQLIKIYTQASADLAFKGIARLDYEQVKKHWTDDLQLAVPFYDSFIYYNNFSNHVCIPTFDFTQPLFFIEDNGLPFDELLRDRVYKYVDGKDTPVIPAQTIYYKDDQDFRAWQTFKCMLKTYGRAKTLEMPNMNHCCSDSFSFKSWKKKNNDFKRSDKKSNKR
jgi:DNA polymerase III alpha subunit